MSGRRTNSSDSQIGNRTALGSNFLGEDSVARITVVETVIISAEDPAGSLS